MKSANTKQNPFNPVPIKQKPQTPDILTDEDIYFYEIAENGHVLKCKMESGVSVKVDDLGGIKDFFNRAIVSASIMTPKDSFTADTGSMTHIEIAAMRMAQAAAQGDLDSAKELFDRVLGKSKQVSESTNLNLTIDDILNGVNIPTPSSIVDIPVEESGELNE
jgi:hypothetical protein